MARMGIYIKIPLLATMNDFAYFKNRIITKLYSHPNHPE
ncbi:hypothetical protein AO375_2024 [Moraxella catarrhalis]|nr:hypothetical protein AO378_0597 [Moraxella catarrhalis]OAV12412.1 hypothetical protein AO375_2024 [Moraxella catarrhalis]OAV12701.1 hypothetical protein AO380_0341 [Moraxella catarrhalis]